VGLTVARPGPVQPSPDWLIDPSATRPTLCHPASTPSRHAPLSQAAQSKISLVSVDVGPAPENDDGSGGATRWVRAEGTV